MNDTSNVEYVTTRNAPSLAYQYVTIVITGMVTLLCSVQTFVEFKELIKKPHSMQRRWCFSTAVLSTIVCIGSILVNCFEYPDKRILNAISSVWLTAFYSTFFTVLNAAMERFVRLSHIQRGTKLFYMCIGLKVFTTLLWLGNVLGALGNLYLGDGLSAGATIYRIVYSYFVVVYALWFIFLDLILNYKMVVIVLRATEGNKAKLKVENLQVKLIGIYSLLIMINLGNLTLFAMREFIFKKLFRPHFEENELLAFSLAMLYMFLQLWLLRLLTDAFLGKTNILTRKWVKMPKPVTELSEVPSQMPRSDEEVLSTSRDSRPWDADSMMSTDMINRPRWTKRVFIS